MDKYITDIVQVYLSIFYFLIMLSNELISGTVLKSVYAHILLSLYLKSIKETMEYTDFFNPNRS